MPKGILRRSCAFCLSLLFFILLFPAAELPVLASSSEYSIIITSNIPFADANDSTSKPFLKEFTGLTKIDDKTYSYKNIDDTKNYQIQIINSLDLQNIQLSAVTINGVSIKLPAVATTNQLETIDNVIDGITKCSFIKHRNWDYTVTGTSNNRGYFIVFSKIELSKDVEIHFEFSQVTGTYNPRFLIAQENVTNAKIISSEFVDDPEDGGSIYKVTAELLTSPYNYHDGNYDLYCYTVGDDTTPFILTLSADNYSSDTLIEKVNGDWQTTPVGNEFVIDENGTQQEDCYVQHFYITYAFLVDSNDDIYLHFQKSYLELSLVNYCADSISIGEYIELSYLAQESDYKQVLSEPTVPLIEGMDGWLYLFITAHGLCTSELDIGYELKLYNGSTDTGELLASYTGVDASLAGRPFANVPASGYIRFTVLELPRIDNKLTVDLTWRGFHLRAVADVMTAEEIPQIQEFMSYYQNTYGLDKFGREAYSDADKDSEVFALYTEYSTYRYNLRKVYSELLKTIAMAGDGNYDAALVAAKRKLDVAAMGADCNAGVWVFQTRSDKGTVNRPILIAMPRENIRNSNFTASDAIEAALEAEWPGNWTYTCTMSQFGAFVTDITAGKASDIGCIAYSTGYNSYGFWYINGKFSDWGVSNYDVQDGDFMAWGDPDVDFYWTWAILRWKLGDAKIAQVLQEKKGIAYESEVFFALGADGLAALFPESEYPDVDWCGDEQFSRYGQLRELGPEEDTIRLINAIGDVSPQSGDAIDAARASYNALDAATKAKVTNYDVLVAAEAAYAKLTAITLPDKVRAALMNSLKADPMNINVRSVDGEWKILALARDITDGKPTITDADEIAKNYLLLLDKALAHNDGTVESLTDYERVTLALSALGIDATQFKYSENSDTYDLTEPFAEYKSNMLLNQAAYALLALNARPYTEDTEDFVTALVDASLDDGGWNLTGVGSPDVDMTAIVIQALAPYYQTDSEVKDAIDLGLKALKDMQDPISGGFYGMGQYNSCSIAQVVVALCSLGIDPTEWTVNGKYNPITALCQFYIADEKDASKGMVKYTLNASAGDQMSTEQAAYALAAYNRLLKGEDTLYDMSNAENNAAALATLKAALEKLDWTLAQEDAENETDAKTAAEAILTDNLSIGVTAVLTVTDFEAAVKGDKDNENGTNGKYSATISLSKGGASTLAEASVTITDAVIAATKWYPNENEKALAELETALAGMDWTLDQEVAGDKEAVKGQVEAKLTTELLDGATATVSISKFTPATEGTEDDEDGEPGSYTAEIALSKGTGELLAELTVTVTGTITAKAYVAPSDLIEVKFRLVGAYPADKDVNLSESDYMPEYVTWIKTTTYTVNKNSTMYDLFVQALKDARLISEGESGGYARTIYAPDVLTGYKLSEFTNGERSGWMYTVNGVHPNIGMRGYRFADDESVMENNTADVVWHYVNDYLYEVDDWVGGSSGTPDTQNLWLKAPDAAPTAVPAAEITLDKSSVSLGEEETFTLTATVLPSYALNKTVTWTSSDESIATVKDGVVTGVKPGDATITANVGDLSATCKVTVKEAEHVPADKIKISEASGTPVATITSFVKDGTATLHVEAAKPCVVVVKNGSSYARLDAAENGSGYDFSVSGYSADMEFYVLLKGDANGNGKLDIADMILAKSALLKKATLSELAVFAADLDGNGLNIADIMKAKSYLLGKTSVDW